MAAHNQKLRCKQGDNMVKVVLTHPRAKAPVRANPGDAGMDIFAVESCTLKPGVHAVLPTGVHMEIPYGYVGLVWPRSGMAVRHGVDVLAGVIDSTYRGEIKVSLINHGFDPVEIRVGDRIAQILIQMISQAPCVVVGSLSDSKRGNGGFGSTGV